MSLTFASSSSVLTAAGMVSSVLRAPSTGSRPSQIECCGSARNRDAQEGRGNGGGILAGALVLPFEQSFQLPLEIRGPIVLLGGVERVHRRPVVVSEFGDEL